MSSTKRVSVITAVYNGEEHLSDAIQSVLNQTYSNFEYIIVNDGSLDRTSDIIRCFSRRDLRVREKHIRNSGPARARNIALQLAQGDLVAILDADDVSTDMRLAEQIAYFDSNPEIGILGTGVELFDGHKVLRRVCYNDSLSSFREQLLHFTNPFPHSTLMFRREVLEDLKGYNERFLRAQDYDFLLRASDLFKMGSLPKPLVKLRYSPDSLTHIDCRQLDFGLAALICAHRRLLGKSDYSRTSDEEWRQFFNRIHNFAQLSGWPQRYRARTYLRQAWFAANAHHFGSCLSSIFRAFINDMACLSRRGIGIRVPRDIQAFLTDDIGYAMI